MKNSNKRKSNILKDSADDSLEREKVGSNRNITHDLGKKVGKINNYELPSIKNFRKIADTIVIISVIFIIVINIGLVIISISDLDIYFFMSLFFIIICVICLWFFLKLEYFPSRLISNGKIVKTGFIFPVDLYYIHIDSHTRNKFDKFVKYEEIESLEIISSSSKKSYNIEEMKNVDLFKEIEGYSSIKLVTKNVDYNIEYCLLKDPIILLFLNEIFMRLK